MIDKLSTLLLTLLILTSCGDDDKPYVPPLNKLTQVSCIKNGSQQYVVDITYDQDGNIAQISATNEGKKYTDSYVFLNNTIAVTGNKVDSEGNASTFLHTVYNLSRGNVVRKEEKQINQYMNNEVYNALTTSYSYSSNTYLSSISQTVLWPKETGKGYNERNLGEVDKFTWQNYDMTSFANLPRNEMTVSYTTIPTPENFTYRIIGSLAPVTFEALSPINLLFGSSCRNLPEKAYWYDVTDASNTCAEYNYKYITTGEYVTGMTIQEKIYPVQQAKEESNTYEFAFVYNYQID